MTSLDLKRNVLNGIHEVLSDHGFRRRGNVWRRELSSLLHVIECQFSRWDSSAECSFTIEVGVFVPMVYRLLWGSKEGRSIHASDCYPRYRIGELAGVETDLWWNVTQSDLATSGLEEQKLSDCLQLIENVVLRYFDTNTTLEDVMVGCGIPSDYNDPHSKLSLVALVATVRGSGLAISELCVVNKDLNSSWKKRAAILRDNIEKMSN